MASGIFRTAAHGFPWNPKRNRIETTGFSPQCNWHCFFLPETNFFRHFFQNGRSNCRIFFNTSVTGKEDKPRKIQHEERKTPMRKLASIVTIATADPVPDHSANGAAPVLGGAEEGASRQIRQQQGYNEATVLNRNSGLWLFSLRFLSRECRFRRQRKRKTEEHNGFRGGRGQS